MTLHTPARSSAADAARPTPTAPRSPVEPTIFERSTPGRAAYVAPPADVPERPLDELIPAAYRRAAAPELPELSELQVVRHFTRLSQKNYSIDGGFYPLGSCTMKYNPKLHEKVAALPQWAALHPHQPEETVQGVLRLLYDLARYLCAVGGMDEFTLQPAAGAHGELVGMMIARAYHASRGEAATRRQVLVPDGAHGTNPASAAAAGFEVVTIPSNAEGRVDLAALRAQVGPQTAALMLTNPNTCGLFERDIVEIAAIIHDVGGLLYYDGANLNAIMGTVRPGDMGFDIVHFNLHKTMTTPHGGGGPGTGPVGVKETSNAIGSTTTGPTRLAGRARFMAMWACWCAPIPMCGRWGRRGCARPAATPCSTLTTCGRWWPRPLTCRSAAPACTSLCYRGGGSAARGYARWIWPSG